jgi:hypothetical protein
MLLERNIRVSNFSSTFILFPTLQDRGVTIVDSEGEKVALRKRTSTRNSRPPPLVGDHVVPLSVGDRDFVHDLEKVVGSSSSPCSPKAIAHVAVVTGALPGGHGAQQQQEQDFSSQQQTNVRGFFFFFKNKFSRFRSLLLLILLGAFFLLSLQALI